MQRSGNRLVALLFYENQAVLARRFWLVRRVARRTVGTELNEVWYIADLCFHRHRRGRYQRRCLRNARQSQVS